MKSVFSIANNAFVGCTELKEFKIGKSDKYSVEDGVLYNQDITELVIFPSNKELINSLFLVPETVIKIAECSFSNIKNIGVRLPRKLSSISAFAFQNAQDVTITIYRGVTTAIKFRHRLFKIL